MIVTLLGDLSHASWLMVTGKIFIAVAGVVGIIAIISPAWFARIAQVGATWIDTKPFFQRMDRPFYFDVPLMLHSRVFGVAVVLGAAALVWLTPSTASWSPIAWTVAGGLALLGAIAAVWPNCFRRMAHWGNTWVDTSRVLGALDRRIDIDRFAVRHSRAFGIFVLASICLMAALWYWGR